MTEFPVELFVDSELEGIYARCGYTVGHGTTVEEAIEDLRRQLRPEAKKDRIERAWNVKSDA